MTTTELPALLTRSEAAKVLRVHPSTLSRWAAAGEGPRCIWLSTGTPNQPPLHVAFRAANRQQVDAFHAAALAAGGRDNGAPGLRPHYHPDYYGAFVLDPDGNNIEVVHHGPCARSAPSVEITF